MGASKVAEITRYAILPILLIALVATSLLMRGGAVAHSFPLYHTVLLYGALIVLERAFA